jgi:hypothetical protein
MFGQVLSAHKAFKDHKALLVLRDHREYKDHRE